MIWATETDRTHRSIVTECLNVYVIEGDILGTDQESSPARAVQEGDTFDINVGGIVGQEEDGTVVGVASILLQS
jgi:hypothetical protein